MLGIRLGLGLQLTITYGGRTLVTITLTADDGSTALTADDGATELTYQG